MIIDVARLPEGGERFESEDPASVLELRDEEAILPQGPIRSDVHAVLVSGELIVRGTVRLAVQVPCSRCGEPFDMEVRDPKFEAVREIGILECVDLTPDVREATLLAFPSHPVCRESCKGLCPACGANWNRNSCDCSSPTDNRWGALDGLEVR